MVVNLEVGIDASKMVSGSREGFQALVQLTNATRHLMEGLELAGGGGGALGRFGALMSRMSPYIMAATAAMGAISLAMGIFGGKTGEAADAQQRLAESIAKARKEQELAASLGESTLPGLRSQASALRSSLNSNLPPISAADFAKREGISQEGLIRILAQRGNADAETAIQQGGGATFQKYSGGRVDRMVTTDVMMSAEEQDRMLRARYRMVNDQIAAQSGVPSSADMSSWGLYPGSITSRGPVGQPVGMGLNFPAISAANQFNGVSQSEQDQATVSYERYAKMQRESSQEQLEAMRQMEESARSVGSALGDAATRFVTGMATARELAASLATDLLRAGLTEAATAGVRGIFKSFGATAAQGQSGEAAS